VPAMMPPSNRWHKLVVFCVISLLIVVPVLIWEKTALTEGDHGHQAQVSLASQKPTNRTKRSLTNKNDKTTDSCWQHYGGIELN